MTQFSPAAYSLKIITDMSIEYVLFAGLFYLVFYVWKNKKFWFSKIQQRYPGNEHIAREIKYSFITLLVFGSVIFSVIWAFAHGHTLIYIHANKHGYTWYFLSIVLMVLIHDTYFYWTHRLLHWKPLFKWVHKTHHLSINPTPFAAYAFHPVEALIVIGIVPVLVFTVPHHVSAAMIFSSYSLFVNVMGHLGYELFPKWFVNHRIFKWHNTSTHHNMHHRMVKCNYGLYLNFWDRIMKTNHPDYEECYKRVIVQREQGELIAELENAPIKIDLSFSELAELAEKEL